MPQPLLVSFDPSIDDELADVLRKQPESIFVCLDDSLTDSTKARLYDALKSVKSTFKVL